MDGSGSQSCHAPHPKFCFAFVFLQVLLFTVFVFTPALLYIHNINQLQFVINRNHLQIYKSITGQNIIFIDWTRCRIVRAWGLPPFWIKIFSSLLSAIRGRPTGRQYYQGSIFWPKTIFIPPIFLSKDDIFPLLRHGHAIFTLILPYFALFTLLIPISLFLSPFLPYSFPFSFFSYKFPLIIFLL